MEGYEMEGGTPNSFGRGRRTRVPPSQLTYPELGKPSTQPVNVLQRKPADNFRQGETGVTPVGAPAPARSVVSVQSSASTRIRQNKLEAKKKIAALEEEMEEKIEELDTAKAQLISAQELQATISGRSPSQLKDENLESVEHEIREQTRKIAILSAQLARLEKSYQRRKDIILEEEELQKEMIDGENADAAKSSVDDEERKARVDEWVHDTQDGREDIPDANGDDVQNTPQGNQNQQQTFSPRSKATDSVAQLATAITQAMSQVRVQPSISRRHDDLPIFDGDNAGDWPLFLAEFERTTAKFNVENSENIIRLRKALKGKAADTVHHLFANIANVPDIIDTLRQRFGQPKFVLDALARKAKLTPAPDIAKPDTIIDFGIAIQALVTNIESYKQVSYLHSVDLLGALVKKLPNELSSKWFEWLDDDESREDNLKSFSTWIGKELRIAYRRAEPSTKNEKPDRRNRHVGVTNGKEEKPKRADDRKKPYCVKCEVEGHHIRECDKFAGLKLEARKAVVKEKRLCYSCLRKGHRTSDCKSKKTCQKSGCSESHHILIHEESKGTAPPNQTNTAAGTPEAEGPPSTHHGNVNQSAGEDLLRYIPVKLRGPKEERACYAMIDNGAQLSLLDEQLAVDLGLVGKKEPLHIGVFNGKESKVDSMKVKFEVAGDYANAKFHEMNDVHTLNSLDLPAQSVDVQKLYGKYPALKAAPLRSQDKAKPLLIIGSDYWRLGYPREKVEASPTSPAAIKTTLGWLLIGCEGRSISSRRGLFHLSSQQECELTRIVKEFICLDDFGVKKLPTVRSKEDETALAIMENTTKYVGDRWETGLLWRNPNQAIPESKTTAIKRLHGIEQRADGNSEFADIYTGRFEEYIQKGYLKPVEMDEEAEKKYYLPHFFAYHPNKKPRLVYDAASKANGKSFNDFFLTGPDLLQSLPKVLLRFRRHKIGVIGDIREMFHQVRLVERDQPMQTILYRGMERGTPPKEYKMTVLFFGSVCSPASAIYAKDRNAMEFEKEHPAIVRAIVHDTYMDDFLSGAETEKEATELQRVVTQINLRGGFPVAKWSSSNVEVLNSIPEDLRAVGSRSIATKSDLPMEKTFGLRWDPAEDVFRFTLNMGKLPQDVQNGTRNPTKREVVSFLMSLFDPLGFLTPLKIIVLIIFQATWREGTVWNAEIPDELNKEWRSWIEKLQQIENVSIPRCIRTGANCNTTYELHTFCDASQEAYAAVCFLRGTTGNDVEVSFLAGKGRVAPIKGLSVPRMELQAALMGARLADTIVKSYGEDLVIAKKVYWSDSRTVLCWLRSQSGRFSPYVSNRVNEVLTLSEMEQWRWIPTKENVADDATRSELKYEFTSDCRWLKGVPFLAEEEDAWPIETPPQEPVNPKDLEVTKTVLAVTKGAMRLPLPRAEDYSSWFTVVKKTASWIASFRAVRTKQDRIVTGKDMARAKLLWCKQVQQDSFPDEIRSLQNGEVVDKRSQLYKLSPTMNEDGLIVLQSRIQKVPNISESVKNPVILDPKHRFTRLLIRWTHVMNAHQGQETVINELRKQYWILECRCAVRVMISMCKECKLQRAKPVVPIMRALPEGRMSANEPAFTHTGVDCFGPMEVTIGRRHEKRWGVLFTCLSTRAVYIDLVPSSSSSDFIDCLIRFNSRRGPAKHIWSDNGTNLRGADNEIRKCIAEWDQKQIRDELLQRGSEWHFIAPASPHMGGSWERLIGIAKKILRKILKCRTPREYTLLTLLTEVENIMNSRPLTAVSPDPKDPECITPNHLLKLKSAQGQLIPGDYSDGERTRRMSRFAQKLADEFWMRWKDEYLPTLTLRSKWNTPQEPIREGDIVILLDDQAKRNDWKKGVIIKAYPGEDHQVRVVEVKVPFIVDKKVTFKTYSRHVVKVIPTGINVNDKTASCGREECYGLDAERAYKQTHTPALSVFK